MASSLDHEPMEESENQLQKASQGDSMHDLQVGDLVWGKVKSHPWWPGHIFNESFAGSSVRKTRHAEGRKPNAVLVAFFGDSSYGWFDPSELVPFAPNFAELSTQANYKSFINAVSEAVDEASRRGALSVTCKCRDESNFAPTGVDNYVFVDVPGYEGGGIYSLEQIEAAREMFDPAKASLFVADLALGPNACAATYSEGEDVVNLMKLRAMMVGYRRAVYEERDDTYAQAFGVDPAKIDKNAVSDAKKKQRAVPLSGQLKIAETLGGSNKKRAASSQSTSSSVKPPKSKQKPKPKQPPSQIQHQPRFKSTPSKKALASAAAAVVSAPASVRSAINDDDKYLLKRRDDAGPNTAVSPLPDLPYSAPVSDQPVTSVLVSPVAESVDVAGADSSFVLQRREKKEEGEEKEKKQVKEKPLQKRKKVEGGQTSALPGVKSEGGEGSLEKKRKKKKKPVEFNAVDLNIPQSVSSLLDLASNPLGAKEHEAAAPAIYLALNFRSAVYKKSLAKQAASGKSDVAAQKLKMKKEKRASDAMPPKQLVKKQVLKKVGDSSSISGASIAPSPSVIGRKREPSDRQEELQMKKKKKLDKIKTLATEKKAGLANASKVIEEEKKKETKVQKPEPPPVPKVPCYTALMMKFPVNAGLPSIATLKAKLARFGQIDLSNTRVYWNSRMCKVTFKFNEDAKAALNYVTSNEIFGQLKVQYYIKEIDFLNQESKPDSRAPVEPVPVRPGNRIGLESTETRSQPSLLSQPPKSILKKPGEDSGASAVAGNGPRVTFMLDRTNSRTTRIEPPPSTAVGSDGGSATNKSGILPPPPPLVLRPPVMHPTRPPYDVRHLPPPPPLRAAQPGTVQWAGDRRPAHELVGPGVFDPVQSNRNGPFGAYEDKKKEVVVDISEQFLGLLNRCSDIVAKVKNSLGYLPYHPL